LLRAGLRRKEGPTFGRFPAVKTAGYYQSSGWLAGLFARLGPISGARKVRQKSFFYRRHECPFDSFALLGRSG